MSSSGKQGERPPGEEARSPSIVQSPEKGRERPLPGYCLESLSALYPCPHLAFPF
jgi:hypothetical protein